MIIASFLSFLLGGIGPFAVIGLAFLALLIIQNKIIHFVEFEDNTVETF